MTDPPLPITGSIPVARGALVAVVVTRGRTPWLPATLAAIAAQTRAPTRVLVVDAAPRPDPATRLLPADDAVARLARGVLDDVAPLWAVAAPGARTFGDAVRRALAVPGAAPAGAGAVVGGVRSAPRTGAIPVVGGDRHRPDRPRTAATPVVGAERGAPRTGAIPTVGGRPPEVADWLWLLHDDSAPEPDALSELLRAVEHAPSVGVAGAKQRSWDDPARLLEVGVTTSRLGRRMTGIEDGEVDQGQHDGRQDVLGVGLAGALVRRDVWDELEGPDPALGPFGDGLDVSRRARLAGHRVVVVPRAVVRHAQASYAGLRDDDRAPDPRRSFAARRRAHVHARLASVPLPLLPLQTLVFLVAAVVRSLLRVAAKDGRLAAAELAAPVVAVLHPARMARSRSVARRARRLPRRSLRVLQNTWREVFREERDRALARSEARRVVQAPSELELAELAALATRRRLGLAALVVALAGLTTAVLGPLVVAAIGGRTRWWAAGCCPRDGDLGDLWRAATLGWVPAGLGVAAARRTRCWRSCFRSPPSPAAGRPPSHVLLLGGLLVAGLGAWFAAGAATRSIGLRRGSPGCGSPRRRSASRSTAAGWARSSRTPRCPGSPSGWPAPSACSASTSWSPGSSTRAPRGGTPPGTRMAPATTAPTRRGPTVDGPGRPAPDAGPGRSRARCRRRPPSGRGPAPPPCSSPRPVTARRCRSSHGRPVPRPGPPARGR